MIYDLPHVPHCLATSQLLAFAGGVAIVWLLMRYAEKVSQIPHYRWAWEPRRVRNHMMKKWYADRDRIRREARESFLRFERELTERNTANRLAGRPHLSDLEILRLLRRKEKAIKLRRDIDISRL